MCCQVLSAIYISVSQLKGCICLEKILLQNLRGTFSGFSSTTDYLQFSLQVAEILAFDVLHEVVKSKMASAGNIRTCRLTPFFTQDFNISACALYFEIL